jgi:environmental stress-induced protein Ves
LHFQDRVKLPVPPLMPVRFSGDRPAMCRLAAGACTDINVIARPDQVAVEIAMIDAPADLPAGVGSALRENGGILVRLGESQALRVSFQHG